REARDRLLQHLLHREIMLLPLPAAEGPPVIFDDELVARHQSSSRAGKAPSPGLRPTSPPEGEVRNRRRHHFTSPSGGEVAAQRRVRGPCKGRLRGPSLKPPAPAAPRRRAGTWPRPWRPCPRAARR